VPPALAQPRLAGTVFSASAATQLGLDYVLEYKDSVQASVWTPAATVTGNGNTASLTDTSATSVSRYYRLRAQWH